MHLGLILPNFGEGSTPEGIRRMAEAAEELGFDSVWATEHIIVGPEAVTSFGRVYDPLVVLAWVAGFTKRIGLGTSIVLLPSTIRSGSQRRSRRCRSSPVGGCGWASASAGTRTSSASWGTSSPVAAFARTRPYG